MGVDVVDVLGLETGAGDRCRDDTTRRGAGGLGVRDVVRFGADRPTCELGDDTHAALLATLEHEKAGAFAEVEAATPAIEGPARLGIDRTERVEAAQGEAAQAIAAAGDDRIDLARTEPGCCDDHGVGAARAGGR